METVGDAASAFDGNGSISDMEFFPLSYFFKTVSHRFIDLNTHLLQIRTICVFASKELIGTFVLTEFHYCEFHIIVIMISVSSVSLFD